MDGKVHIDLNHIVGLMEVISTDKTGDNLHLTMTPRIVLLFMRLLLKRPNASCAK